MAHIFSRAPMSFPTGYSLERMTRDAYFPEMSDQNLKNAQSSLLLRANLEQLAEELILVERILGRPAHILSAFRCAKLNALYESSPLSQHRLGEAVDFYLMGMENTEGMMDTLEAIRSSGIRFHRLAIERGSIHFGTYRTGQPNGEVVICDDRKSIVLQEATLEQIPVRAATSRRASRGGNARDKKQ